MLKPEKMTKKNYLPAIAIMFALFFMIAFITGLHNPLGIIVKFQFGFSNAASQLGNLINFLAYACMGLPAGYILKKYGYKVSSLVAVSVGILGVGTFWLSGLLSNFWVYLLGAFISGFAACMLNAVVNPMLNSIGQGGKKGNQLIQYGNSLNSLAATFVPFFIGWLTGQHASHSISDANPAFFIALGVFALAFVIIIFTKIPEPELDEEMLSVPQQKDGIYSCFSFRHFVLGSIAVFVYMGVEIGIANTTNLYLTHEIGLMPGKAGVIVSLFWFFMFIGRLVGGYFGSRFASHDMLSFATFGTMILLIMAIFTPSDLLVSFGQRIFTDIPINAVFLIMTGFFTSVMWGNIFNMAVEGLGKYTSSATGFFMFMVCGGGILPAIQGAIADLIGYIPSFWFVLLCLAYLLFYASSGYKNVNRKIPV